MSASDPKRTLPEFLGCSYCLAKVPSLEEMPSLLICPDFSGAAVLSPGV
jgi:hypothetical protein